MHNTATIPNHVTLKRSTLSLLLVAAVVATATITWGLIATVDSDSVGPAPATPTRAEILDGLSPSAREYVESLMAMTPEQLAAAYGYNIFPVPASPTAPRSSTGSARAPASTSKA